YYVTIPNGKGGRKRRFFDHSAEGKREAKSLIEVLKTQKENEWMTAFGLSAELRIEAVKCHGLLESANATLTDAVKFFLKHAKPAGGTTSLADAITEFLVSKRKSGRKDSYVRNLEFVLNYF